MPIRNYPLTLLSVWIVTKATQSFFFQVPCPFKTEMIKDLHNFLFFEALNNFCLLNILPNPCSVPIYKSSLYIYITDRFPQYIWFWGCPVLSGSFSKPSFLILRPRYFKCLFLKLCTSVILSPFCIKISLLTCSLHGICSTLPSLLPRIIIFLVDKCQVSPSI